MAATAVASTAVVGDTWGISGPLFLVLFAALLAVARLAVPVIRAVMERGGTPPTSLDDLRPCELALVTGGPRDAVRIALVSLWRAGAISPRNDVVARVDPADLGDRPGRRADVADATNVIVTGWLPAGATDLEAAAYARFRGSDRVVGDLGGVCRSLEAGPEVAAIQADVEDRGFLRTADQVRRLRAVVAVFVPVYALGLLRLVVGASRGKPVELLVVLLVGGLFVVASAWPVGPRPRAVDRLLDRARQAGEDRRAAVGTALGAGRSHADEPWAYALYGRDWIWAVAPAVALTLAVPPPPEPSPGWWSSFVGASSGTSSCSGGSGCGGGCGGGSGCGG